MKRIWLNAGLATAAIVTSLLMAELWAIAVFTGDKPSPLRPDEITLPNDLVVNDDVLGRHFRPNADKFFSSKHGEFSVHYQINELGLRDAGTIFPGDRPPHVLVLGDAIAEGWGVMTEATFIRELQRQLRQQKNISQYTRLFNAGMSGFGAAQSYLLGKRLVEDLGADLIILVYTGLMPVADFRFLHQAELNDAGIALRAGTNSVPLDTGNGDERNWFTRSALYGLANLFFDAKLAREQFTPNDPLSDPFAAARDGDSLALHQRSLDHVAALATFAKARGIEFLLVHVPLPHQIAADEFGPGRLSYRLEARHYPSYEADLLGRFCDEQKIECIMSGPSLSEAAKRSASGVFFKHDYAMTEVGHRAMANRLLDRLYQIMVEVPTTRY